jgi:hypothetical protein
MAKDKTSFILYCDLLHTVEKLPDNKAGELFKHILRYVNDLDPATDDLLIEAVFEGIKQQLKRDLVKYEERAQRSRDNGSKGGRPKKPKKPSGLNKNPDEPRKPDSDNVTVTDSVTDSVNEIKKELIIPEWKEFLDYGFNRARDMKKNPLVYEYDLRTKYDTWIDNGWKDNKGNVIKNWKLKLSTYFREGWIKPTTNPDNIAY